MSELFLFGGIYLVGSLLVVALICRLFAINPRDD